MTKHSMRFWGVSPLGMLAVILVLDYCFLCSNVPLIAFNYL